jgi:hypothetical protein
MRDYRICRRWKLSAIEGQICLLFLHPETRCLRRKRRGS